METLFLNESWNPGAVFVVLNKLILDISDLDKPCIKGSVDQRGIRSPAERITMDNGSRCNQSPHSFQLILDGIISILNILPFEV
jgi:hypothetical protein